MTASFRCTGLFVAVLLLGAGMTGCNPFAKPVTESELNQGYGIYYNLMKSESGVKDLLIIRSAADPVAELIREISATAESILETMDEWKEADPLLNYRQTGLPKVEKETRRSIAEYRAQQLMLGGEDTFERNLILTQIEASTYAWHFAKALAEDEESDERKAVIEEWAKAWEKHAESASKLLVVHREDAAEEGSSDSATTIRGGRR